MLLRPNDIDHTYQHLRPVQKDLLKVLVLIDSPESKAKILQVAIKAKLNGPNKQPYNAITLGRALDLLRGLHLVKKNLEQNYQIHPTAYAHLMRQALQDRRCSAWRKALLAIMPSVKDSRQAHHYPQYLLRDASHALFTNNYKSFKKALDLLFKKTTTYPEAIYKQLFVERFGKQHIHELAPAFQFTFYRSQLGDMILSLENVSAPLETIQSISSELQREEVELIHYHVSLHALLRGDWQIVQKHWANQDSFHALLFKGWLYFAQGYNVKALNRYERALQLHRKKQGYRAYFEDYHGVIFILALLKDHNSKHNSTIKQYIKEVFTRRVEPAYVYLSTSIDHLQHPTDRAQELFEQEHLYYNLDGLLYLYAQYWTQHFAPNWESYALTLQHKAIKNGYYWVAYNVAVLMQEIATQRQEFYANKVEELSTIVGPLPSLLDVIGRQEEWEIALQALESLNGSTTTTTANQQSRLVWLVDFEREIIQPKIQRINKSGAWSKGRNAPLDKLIEGSVAEATPHDWRVINTLSRTPDYFPTNTTYGFHNPTKTFRTLVNHPLLFLHKSPEVACELRQGTAELIVRETPEGYQLSPSIRIQREGCYIIRETATRYQLIEVNDKQVELAQSLGGDHLLVPFKGKAQLERTLAGLSHIMPLQSDLEFQSDEIASVEADERIYIQLLPVGEGFQVEFLVKPFREFAPYFKPGEGSARVVGNLETIRTQTRRDLEGELTNYQTLLEGCTSLSANVAEDGLWQLKTPNDCLQLLRELEPFKTANAIVIEWPKGEQLRIKRQLDTDSLQLTLERDQDWFGVSGTLQINEHLVMDMRQLLQKMQAQQSDFIELDDGQFLALSDRLRQQLEGIYNYTDEDGGIHPLATLAMEELLMDSASVSTNEAWRDHIQRLRSLQKVEYPLPRHLKATLRSYQKEGYQWLSQLADWQVGACLADDMGLGKTLQALSILLRRSSNGPSLVVAPASVCRNWIKEIEQFAPTLHTRLFSESDRKKSIQKAGVGDVIITTYGLLQTERVLFASREFETIVLDEAQAIKNSSAKRSQAAMQLRGGFKIITTGTPIENHLGELWNLFRFINPGLLGSRKSFRERFAIPIEKDKSTRAHTQLQHLIRPFILRRHKRDVLAELPEKTEVTLRVNLSASERAFYEALRRNAVEEIQQQREQPSGTQHLQVLAQLMRLRRACCNPQLVDPDSTVKSAKLELFSQTVQELIENGHKALVFSQFVGHLRLIEERVKELGIQYQYLDGQTPGAQRQARIDAFQAGEGDLFLISLKAGGTGLNLTAADYVIHMDPWWNPAVEDQASDRVHRIGQNRPVTVYRLVAEHTIEEKIIKLHEDKRDLADSLLKGTDAASKLSADDLLALIQMG